MVITGERSCLNGAEQQFVLVIGGGQAGLAAGYYLKQEGIPYLIVEKAARIGDGWRNRYTSLTLFTPRSISTLPGLMLAGNRESYPTRDEFANYLERYASVQSLLVRTSTTVLQLTLNADGQFIADLDTGESLQATSVVIATGAFQIALEDQFSSVARGVQQLTSATYKDPSQVVLGRTLIVGDGASGRDIAVELSATHKVLLATGRARKLIPEFVLGKNVWWWLSILGILSARRDSWLGQQMRAADPFPDRRRSLSCLQKRGVQIMPRVISISERRATFMGGATFDIDSVIWAIGYRDDSAWLQVPGTTSDRGEFLHDEGISPVQGIYYVGRPWQRNRASALISGAGPDAREVVRAILRRHEELDGQRRFAP